MSQRRVCLVTDELYPFTAGGIGRLLHNLIRDSLSRKAPVEFHVLVPAYVPMKAAEVEAYFGEGVRLHVAEPRPRSEPSYDEDGVYPPPSAFTDSHWHAESMELMLHLKRLAREGCRFDVIEFGDYRGWAFCTLQEKYLGRAFAGTEVAVRLHSTMGIISQYEPHLPNREALGRFELERKALLDAERVIAHIPGIAEINQRFYGFPDSWLRKVCLEFPPVVEGPQVLPVVEGAETGGGEERDLLFLTKVQWIKRPDLFVRGAALFMRQHPEYRGRALLACHAPFPEYTAALQRMVPRELRERFVFSGPREDREALMARGIVVICSDHEALNLTAYEASAAGATLVLNATCPAFTPETPFVDGESCHAFNGTVEGLASALERAWKAPQLRPASWKVAQPYWERTEARATPTAPVRQRPPRVSVIITNHNLGRYLPETLASVAASSYAEVEVVLVDDASTDSFDHELLERIEQQSGAGRSVRLVRNLVNRGLPASRNIGIQAATGDYLLPLDADDCISPTFLERAVEALERHPEFDVVVPSTGYFLTDEALESRQFCDYALFLGDAPSLGLVSNRFSCATALMRRGLFERVRYNERLTSYEDWDLYLRLALAGHRFLVANQLHFHYRRRHQSMITGVSPRRHMELVNQIYQALPKPLNPSVRLEAFFSSVSRFSEEAHSAVQSPASDLGSGAQPLRYGVIDTMNAALKRLPGVHLLLKQAAIRVNTALAGDPDQVQPLRYVVADRMNGALKRLPGVHTALKRTARTSNHD
ncbi:MAG TPA: glycosyltransferase [Archangium sp.]|jgi:GT2 family glycosyltransferase/glycosyltransferase involved in cell wall biosynthesis|uniref:glycosyltransferase n=1 Tax=Archangium sp. TaxID=1872627 RepID=UPI002EDB236E